MYYRSSVFVYVTLERPGCGFFCQVLSGFWLGRGGSSSGEQAARWFIDELSQIIAASAFSVHDSTNITAHYIGCKLANCYSLLGFALISMIATEGSCLWNFAASVGRRFDVPAFAKPASIPMGFVSRGANQFVEFQCIWLVQLSMLVLHGWGGLFLWVWWFVLLLAVGLGSTEAVSRCLVYTSLIKTNVVTVFGRLTLLM